MPEYVKQNVQWFPGHMAKTRRLIKESLPLVDGVVEIADARAPYSSRNPELAEIIKGKPEIIILNKSDIANAAATKIWIDYFKTLGIYAVSADCRSGKGLNKFESIVKTALKDTIEKNEKKGMKNKPLRLMVVGIPNTGKSSFINRMVKNSKAEVADRAGVTRQNRWFSAGGGIELLDTPGVLQPRFDDPEAGDRLAFIGSVKNEVVDMQTLVCRLLETLLKTDPGAIENRYKIKIDPAMRGWEILEAIGRKRCFLVKGGEIDYERTAVTVADEFRAGLLGRITLELP